MGRAQTRLQAQEGLCSERQPTLGAQGLINMQTSQADDLSLNVLNESPASKNEEMFLSPINSSFLPLSRSRELWPCRSRWSVPQWWAEEAGGGHPQSGARGMTTCLPCSPLLPWPHLLLSSRLLHLSCPASDGPALPQHLPVLGLPLLDTLPWPPTTYRKKPTLLSSALRGLSQWPCSLLPPLSVGSLHDSPA